MIELVGIIQRCYNLGTIEIISWCFSEQSGSCKQLIKKLTEYGHVFYSDINRLTEIARVYLNFDCLS